MLMPLPDYDSQHLAISIAFAHLFILAGVSLKVSIVVAVSGNQLSSSSSVVHALPSKQFI